MALLASGCAGRIDAAPGSVLFQDDFSWSITGWDRIDEPDLRGAYQEGGYHLRLDHPDGLAWSTPGFRLDDVRLEVEALPVDGPDDNAYGLICRYQDPDNFYFFLISSDGFAGIGAVRDGRREMLTAATLQPAEGIRLGRSPNHLRADCVGPRLGLTVNGVPAGEVLAADWLEGDVGLIAGSYRQAGVEIRFDNFLVIAP